MLLRVGRGRELKTIQAGLDAAQHGDVLRIEPGTYREALWPDADVKLEADTPGRVTVTGVKGHALYVMKGLQVEARGIVWTSTSAERGPVSVDGGALRLERCTVRGQAKGSAGGVQITSGSLELVGCTVEGGAIGVLAGGGSTRLHRVRIRATALHALEVAGRARVSASHVDLVRPRGSGALVASGELQASRLRIVSPAFDGLYILGGTVRLDGVSVTSPGRAGVWLEDRPGKRSAWASRLRVSGGEAGVRVGKAAALALEQSTLSGCDRGVVNAGGRVALEGVRIARWGEHAIDAAGGTLEGGRVALQPRTAGAVVTQGRTVVKLEAASVAPFMLVLHAGAGYSMIADDFRALLGGKRAAQLARRVELNGYGVSAWVEALVEADRALARSVVLDPEAGMFAASSSSRDALAAVAARVLAALADDAAFTASLARARAA